MSEQIILGGAHHRGEGALHSVKSALMAFLRVTSAAQAVHARAKIRPILREYSAEQLASFGWSQDEIRRLKSV